MNTKEAIRVSQFARIEGDKNPGFKAKFLVDRQGCPACGNITKYELKPPTMPAVSTCQHCRGPEEKKLSAREPMWLFNYTYIPQLEKTDQDFVFTLKKSGTDGQPFTVSVAHHGGLLFEQSCTQVKIGRLIKELVLKTDLWSKSNLGKPIEKSTYTFENTVTEYSDAQVSRVILRAVHSSGKRQVPSKPFYPVKKGSRGSTMVNFRPGSSIYSIFLERVKDQPDWTLQFYHEKSGGMYEVGNRIRMDHWAVLRWAFVDLIRKAIRNLRTRELPDPSIHNTYINQHAWPEYALEDRFVLDALESAFRYLTREYKIARQQEAAPRTVQTDLFAFFPQEAGA